MIQELDDVSNQIILAIGDKGAKKISDLEDYVWDASKQAIWDAAELLITNEYLREEEGELSLTEKAYDTLRIQRSISYDESVWVLEEMFRAETWPGHHRLTKERLALINTYILLLATEKLTAGISEGSLRKNHEKALDVIQPVQEFMKESAPKLAAKIEAYMDVATKNASSQWERKSALDRISKEREKLLINQEFLDSVDMEAADLYSKANELFLNTVKELTE